jgi:hypothetical protein
MTAPLSVADYMRLMKEGASLEEIQSRISKETELAKAAILDPPKETLKDLQERLALLGSRIEVRKKELKEGKALKAELSGQLDGCQAKKKPPLFRYLPG